MKIVVFFLISIIYLNAKDVVVTKDGNIYRGKIQKYDEKELTIKINENNIFNIPSENILNVDFDNDIDVETEMIDDKYTNGIGISLFYPGGYNINYDLVLNKIIAGLSLGTDFDFLYSGEFNLRYPIHLNKEVYIAPNIFLGYQYYDYFIDDFVYTYYNNGGSKLYLGTALNISVYGLFINFGFIYQTSDHVFMNYLIDDPIYLKIGYNYYY